MALCLQNIHLRAHQATATLQIQLKNHLHLVVPKNGAALHEVANDPSLATTVRVHNAENALQDLAQAATYIAESQQAMVRAKPVQSALADSDQNDLMLLAANAQELPVEIAPVEIETNARAPHAQNVQAVDSATTEKATLMEIAHLEVIEENALVVSVTNAQDQDLVHLAVSEMKEVNAQDQDLAENDLAVSVENVPAAHVPVVDLEEVFVDLPVADQQVAEADVAVDQVAVEVVMAPR